MKRRVGLFVSTAAVVMLCLMGSGCATILSGPHQTVKVTSEPEGVRVTADDGTSVVTPGKLKLSRKSTHVLVASYEGCEDQERELRKGTNGAVFGNILIGGLIGLGVDFASGAVYALNPSEVRFDFTEEGQALAARQAEFLRENPVLGRRIRFAIQNGLAERKMTREQLLVAIGEPDAVRQDGQYEVLTYNNRKPSRYYLKEDVLVETRN